MRVSQRVRPFFFSIGLITNFGTCIRHHNKPGSLRITSLLLDIVSIYLNSILSSLNESMYTCQIKFI